MPEDAEEVVQETNQTDSHDTDDRDDLIQPHDKQQQHRNMLEQQKQPTMTQSKSRIDLRTKQRKFTQQRSILKNSVDCTPDEHELLEAKKQFILRRRRLFSHYRQYEQWRRKQFSYDPSYFRPHPLPIGQMAGADGYGGITAGIGVTGANAFRRRRQYRRQYSCAERSREGSRESRESSSLCKYRGMVASDTINTDSSINNYTNNHSEPASFDSSECGGTTIAYPTLHCNSRHIHMLPEEHSASLSERCTRSRINSAIFVSSEGRGFDSIEFLRRHGSQSVLCRKAKSAENITDNGRKKSFAEKRHWRTDEDDTAHNDIELKECGGTASELHTLSVIKANHEPKSPATAVTSMLARSAAITTSNIVVGSISLETPPSYMKDEDTQQQQNDFTNHYATSSQDSIDNVENKLIQIPVCVETRPRVLVHQRSSTASSSPQGSPKNFGLKIIKPKISSVPMVSVSGPSPPVEKPPLAECL